MHDLFLLHSVLHKKEVQRANVFQAFNFWFFNVLVIKWKLFKIVYYIRITFNFLQNCHYYALQKCLNKMMLKTKTTKNTIKNGHIFQITRSEL